MPGRIQLAEHERLAVLTKEQAEVLAGEIEAAVSQVAAGMRERVGRELVAKLVLSHSQLLTAAVVQAIRRRHPENSAIVRLVTPASTGPLVMPSRRN